MSSGLETVDNGGLEYATGSGLAYWLGQIFEASQLPFQLKPDSVVLTSFLIIIAGLVGSALSVRLITKVEPIIALGRER